MLSRIIIKYKIFALGWYPSPLNESVRFNFSSNKFRLGRYLLEKFSTYNRYVFTSTFRNGVESTPSLEAHLEGKIKIFKN